MVLPFWALHYCQFGGHRPPSKSSNSHHQIMFGESILGGNLDKGIWLYVKNWEQCLGRNDVKHNLWFRCSNRLLEDDDFDDFDLAEICVWIHILSQVSLRKAGEVFINFDSSLRKSRLPKKTILSAIKKLEEKQIVRVTLQDPSAIRPDCVRDPCATDRQTDKQTPEHGRAPDGSLPELVSNWNTHTKRPKIKEWNKDRKSKFGVILEKYGEDAWNDAVNRVERSDFLAGRTESWGGATFDWLINPKNFVKVIEGNYENKSKTASLKVLEL